LLKFFRLGGRAASLDTLWLSGQESPDSRSRRFLPLALVDFYCGLKSELTGVQAGCAD